MEHSTSGRAAAQVAAEMTRQGMSLRTLSAATGIPLATLHRTMRSGRSLSLTELDLIAAALNVEPAALIADHACGGPIAQPYTQPHVGSVA